MLKSDDNFKKIIYSLMNGYIELEKYSVIENEFGEGKFCDIAYSRITAAKNRLYERLGVEEDGDVETIFDNFSMITEYLSIKMYDYGYIFSQIDRS